MYEASTVHIELQSELEGDGKATAGQTWEVASADGNSLVVKVEYKPSATHQSEIKTKVYSGSQPGFFRLYGGNQVTDLVYSAVMGVDHTTNLSVIGYRLRADTW